MGKVKDQLIDQQDQEYQKSLEPDFDDYAAIAWDKVDEEGEYCKGCIHCERTKDAYGTGDSPTMRECTVSDPSECPGLN